MRLKSKIKNQQFLIKKIAHYGVIFSYQKPKLQEEISKILLSKQKIIVRLDMVTRYVNHVRGEIIRHHFLFYLVAKFSLLTL